MSQYTLTAWETAPWQVTFPITTTAGTATGTLLLTPPNITGISWSATMTCNWPYEGTGVKYKAYTDDCASWYNCVRCDQNGTDYYPLDYTGDYYATHPYLQKIYTLGSTRAWRAQYDWTTATNSSAWKVYGPGIAWAAGTVNSVVNWHIHHVSTAEQRRNQLRAAIRNRLRPASESTREPLGPPGDIREQRARETLRRLLGEQRYRLFVTNGFVSAKGRSGKVYQIFPGKDITRVYQGGQLRERLCVVLTGDFPPTDSLIVRYLMILNNEEDFRARAVQHGLKGLQPQYIEATDNRTLLEIARDNRMVG